MVTLVLGSQYINGNLGENDLKLTC